MKYIAITGASSGIGYEAAKAFARRGYSLILTARHEDRLEALKEEMNPSLDVVTVGADLSLTEDVYRFYDVVKKYEPEALINNAGFGNYGSVSGQDMKKIAEMLRLDVEAVVMLSSMFARDFKETPNTQIINVSSAGGYIIVPNAVTYCAAKFFVSAFTEGLARELRESGACMRAKVFAPAATRTGFGMRANDTDTYDYAKAFRESHSAEEAAGMLMKLYDSDAMLGIVDRGNFSFRLCDGMLEYAGRSVNNQRV